MNYVRATFSTINMNKINSGEIEPVPSTNRKFQKKI